MRAPRLRDVVFASALLFLLADRALPSIGAFAQSGPPTAAAAGEAQTRFTYQGRLEFDGIPANGEYQFTVNLWDAAAGGSMLATWGPAVEVPVTNGIFILGVDFGLPYSEGLPRWIEVLVRPNSSADPFIPLGRQELTGSPHDHLYQDWIGSGALPGLSLRNLGAGDALYVEASSGNAIDATSSGSAPTLGVSNQGSGGAISASSVSTDPAIAGAGSLGIGVAGSTFARSLPGVFGANGAGNCVLTLAGNRLDLSTACPGLVGVADSTESGGLGVYGNGSSVGIFGKSDVGSGVRGESHGTGPGIEGLNDGPACSPALASPCAGVHGKAAKRGVVGQASGFCNSLASISSICIGVAGEATGSAAGVGVMGKGSFAGIYGDVSGGAAYAGYFNGDVYINGSILPAPSDANLKHGIGPATSGLDAIRALKPSTYAWNDPAPWDDEGREHNGFIAQEVRGVIPSAVYVRDDAGTLGLDYNEITAVLVKAMQEQQAQIDTMTGGASSNHASTSPARMSWATVLLSALASGVAATAVILLGRPFRHSTVNSSPTSSAPV